MWTIENRAGYNRDHLRYPSDVTNDEWAHVEPLIPPAKRGGGKRRVDMRTVVNGVMPREGGTRSQPRRYHRQPSFDKLSNH